MHRYASLAVFASMTASALAQTTADTTVTYSLSWRECNSNGTPVPAPNGMLEPGESVLFRMSVSFTNQNGVATFTPPAGTFSSGTLRGFGFGFLDLVGIGPQTTGSWNLSAAHGLGVHPDWNLVGPSGSGTPTANGSQVLNIQFGQFHASPASIVGTNPIVDIYKAVWTPASYVIAEREFHLRGALAAAGSHSVVLLELGPTLLAGVSAPANFGSVVIPLPAPATLPLLAIAALFRRSRR
jgi:hypothetical protein